MLVDTANSCGIYLLSLLIRCVFELGVSDTSAVKCVRYALQAIDCAFFYLGTRHTLLYALCMCQNDNSMILKEIVQQCSTDHGNCSSEESIQCYKLRRIVSQHLNNILRLTDNLAEYFPLSSSTYLRSKYEQVNESLRRNNDTDGLAKRLIIQRVPFLASKWFYHLALVWQG